MSHPEFSCKRINPVLLDLNEMEREKSPIFPFPFHSNQVKQDLSFVAESLGRLIFSAKVRDDS